MEAVKAIAAVGSLLSGYGAVKSAAKEAPKPPPIPTPKPAAVMPVADDISARYAAQRKLARRAGKRSDTFLTERGGSRSSKLG